MDEVKRADLKKRLENATTIEQVFKVLTSEEEEELKDAFADGSAKESEIFKIIDRKVSELVLKLAREKYQSR